LNLTSSKKRERPIVKNKYLISLYPTAFVDLLGAARVPPDGALRQRIGDVPVVPVGGVPIEIAVGPGVEVGVARVGRRNLPVLVIHVELPRHHQLLGVVEAHDAVALGLGLGQRRQEHARQDGDDGDDHQQFDQGEAFPGALPRRPGGGVGMACDIDQRGGAFGCHGIWSPIRSGGGAPGSTRSPSSHRGWNRRCKPLQGFVKAFSICPTQRVSSRVKVIP